MLVCFLKIVWKDSIVLNPDLAVMIEIENLFMLSLHMVEITGMYELLGRNMCQDLTELL